MIDFRIMSSDEKRIRERLLDDIEHALTQCSAACIGFDIDIIKLQQECLNAFIAPKE